MVDQQRVEAHPGEGGADGDTTRSVAEKPASAPDFFPIGVRANQAITEPDMWTP